MNSKRIGTVSKIPGPMRIELAPDPWYRQAFHTRSPFWFWYSMLTTGAVIALAWRALA